ncbi:hypothetical protein [Microvirga yunnanensis]|uniref:hypothetical protein n=1 Tax=Microvirga yunnanensis TaxID=2953740 RepID=UPI0021C5F010|nr:hypothetical protein [Microvirga sp. HBU65207]
MADTPKPPTTYTDYDAHAIRAFREGLEQARKALRDTDHMVTPDRAKLVHPDHQQEPPKEPK